MAYIEYYNNGSPKSLIQVWISATRSGAQVTVNSTCTCSFRFSDGYIAYNGEINYNMWTWAGTVSSNIKSYSNRWYASSQMSRTVYTSQTFTDTSSNGSVQVGCNVTVASGDAMSLPDQYNWISYARFSAPSAPTWLSINPNPCDINKAPVISWGGAHAGSLGTLYYDLEVQSSTPSGGWTNWYRPLDATPSTSYKEIVLKNMNLYGQTPFVGVKYQYRVRSSDGSYATSGWVYNTVTAAFVSPSSPTSSSWSVNSIKLHPSSGSFPFSLSWSGASGGSGSITQYQIQVRAYHQATKSWTDWLYNTTSNSQTKSMNFPGNFSALGTFKNNDLLQARIRTLNSWNVYSGYYSTSTLAIRGNQMWIKVNGTWREGDCFCKINGTWREGLPFIKVKGTWRESS